MVCAGQVSSPWAGRSSPVGAWFKYVDSTVEQFVLVVNINHLLRSVL